MYLCMNLWDYTSAKLKTLRARSVNLSNLSLSFTCLSPPFQWQRVEPVPLCRSGKLCSPSYNTQNLASRNTTVASRLIKRAHLLTRSLATPYRETIDLLAVIHKCIYRKEAKRSIFHVQIVR